jgi:hypothetical protein
VTLITKILGNYVTADIRPGLRPVLLSGLRPQHRHRPTCRVPRAPQALPVYHHRPRLVLEDPQQPLRHAGMTALIRRLIVSELGAFTI